MNMVSVFRAAMCFLAMGLIVLLGSACAQNGSSRHDADGSSEGEETKDTETLEQETDTAADDSEDQRPWTNPGCDAAQNVVNSGLTLTVRVDLSDYAAQSYAVHEQITVVPELAGNAISLYGEGFEILKASAGLAYDEHVATFCTGPFEAGDVVEVEVDYLVFESPKPPSPMIQFGLHTWRKSASEFAVGPLSSPYFASLWLFVPQALHEVSAADDANPAAEETRLSVVAPDESWKVVGPGGVGEQDGAVWSFHLEKPTPIYALSFAASPEYELFSAGHSKSGVEITGVAFPSSRAGAEAAFSAAASAIDWMEEHIGPYEFGKSLTLAEVPGLGGAMEHTGVIWVSSEALTPHLVGEFVVIHETVHHWWGNNVRFADWPHFWLSEGFTEWSTYYNIVADRLSASSFKQIITQYRQMAADVSQTAAPEPLRFADDDDMAAHAVNLMLFYYYGAAFLEMVDQRLERDFKMTLNELLAKWFALKRFGAATTEDFLAFLEERTGDDVTWKALFDDWVYAGPCPTLALDNYSYALGKTRVEIERLGGAQQNIDLLTIGFILGEETFEVAVNLDAGIDKAVAEVEMPAAPEAVVVDPAGFYVLQVQPGDHWSGPEIKTSY